MNKLLLACAAAAPLLALAHPAAAQQQKTIVASDCSLQTWTAGYTGAALVQRPNGDLCINVGALGTVTVTNAFNLEATQQLVKSDLDSLVAALTTPATLMGTNGTTIMTGANPLNAAPAAATSGGASTYHVIAGASNNSANIKNTAGTVYSITGTSIHTTYQYVRLYDTSSAPTCSSATGVVGGWIIPGATTGSGGTFQIPVGIAFSSGIGICITGGFADTDNTNATASVLSINVNYK